MPSGENAVFTLHKGEKHTLKCSVHGLAALCFNPLVYINLYNLI